MFRALLDIQGNLPSARLSDDEHSSSPIQYQLVHATSSGLELADQLGNG